MPKFLEILKNPFTPNHTNHNTKNNPATFSGASSAKCSKTSPPKRVFKEQLSKQEEFSYFIQASADHREELQLLIMLRIACVPNFYKRALLTKLQQILDSSKAEYAILSGEIAQLNSHKKLYLKLNEFLTKVNHFIDANNRLPPLKRSFSAPGWLQNIH